MISIYTQKAFESILQSFLIKTHKKLEKEGNFRKLMKGIYGKSTTYTYLMVNNCILSPKHKEQDKDIYFTNLIHLTGHSDSVTKQAK